MYDKINRLYSLTRTEAEAKVQDEKIEDTLLDLANYALIALTELENNKDTTTLIDSAILNSVIDGKYGKHFNDE